MRRWLIISGIVFIVAILGFGATMYFTPQPNWATDARQLKVSVDRVVFKGVVRVDTKLFHVKNGGNKPIQVKVSLTNLENLHDGNFTDVRNLSKKFLKSYLPHLRFAPSRFTLNPNDSQGIKIVLQRLPELEPSIFRLFLYFCVVTKKSDLQQECRPKSDQSSITIPIVIDHRKTQ